MMKQWDNPPEMLIDPDKKYRGTMETTRGIIEIDFYPQYAPLTVNNFVFLAREASMTVWCSTG